MSIASNALVIKALDQWARSKGFEVELQDPAKKPLIAVITDLEGFKHDIYMPSSVKLNSGEGCLAVKHPKTGELMKKFATEVLAKEDGVSVKASHFKVDNDKSIDEAIEEIRGNVGSKEKFDVAEELTKINKIIDLIRKAAPSEEEAERALKPLLELKELAELAQSLESSNGCKCPKCTGLSPGKVIYLKSKIEDILLEPVALRDLPVGSFFFDDDRALNIAVGLEKDSMQDEYINSVVIAPSDVDGKYKGMPFKLPLSTIVTPLGKEMPI